MGLTNETRESSSHCWAMALWAQESGPSGQRPLLQRILTSPESLKIPRSIILQMAKIDSLLR